MLWLLAGYMWLFIHRPFEVWPALGMLHIERVYMIVTILYWALAAEKTWIRNRLNIAFLLLGLSILVSAVLSPYSDRINPKVEDWFKIAVFYVLVISTVSTETDLKILVTVFIMCITLYVSHSLREFICGRHWYKMDTMRMIGVDVTMNDPNTFSATILYALPMVYPLWNNARIKWQRLLIIGYVGLSIFCILLTGSRSSFVGLCLLGFIAAMLSRHRFVVLAFLAITAPIIWINLREDLQNRFLTLLDPSYGPKNAQASAESRAQGWYDGVRIWKENPIFGCAPGNFGKARGFDLESHHLYGQVLGELGTFGAFAFIFLLGAFLSNAIEWWRIVKLQPVLKKTFLSQLIVAINITVFLMLVMGFAGHNLYRYTWLWYGAFEAIALVNLHEKTFGMESICFQESVFA